MRSYRTVAVLAGILVAGCAARPSVRMPQPVGGGGTTAVHDTASVAAWPTPLDANAVLPGLRELRGTLRNRLRPARAAGLVVVHPVRGKTLVLTLDSSRLFEPGGGQFKLDALEPCARLAAALAGSDHSVVWVIGRGPVDAAGEYGMSMRRAQSVADDLIRNGVSPRRVRVIAHPGRGAGHVDIVIVPLQRGHEVRAYQPPV